MSDKILQLGCQYCNEIRACDRLTSEGIENAMAAYFAHLIESHWEVIERGRRLRLEDGTPINDAWTRL